MRSKDKHVFVDSDFWVGLYRKNDAHHKRSLEMMHSLRGNRRKLVTSTQVVGETMTVLSHKVNQAVARQFYRDIQSSHTPIYFIDEALGQSAKQIFIDLDQKGTSYVDCTNVALMKAYGFTQIIAYDAVYHKTFKLDNLVYLLSKVA